VQIDQRRNRSGNPGKGLRVGGLCGLRFCDLYAAARNQAVACFAHVTNTMATTAADFEKGVDNGAHDALAVARAAADALC
jgi:hypothetical protein